MHVDVNKIFGLFNGGEDKNPKHDSDSNQDMSYLLEDYKQHPMFWVGMFKKLIYNHKVFNAKVLNSFKDLDGELDMNDVENAGEFIMYNRAWYWINKIDIKETLHQNALTHYADEILLTYTKVVILYFQELEEYEKCAHLKKIQDFLESILK
jgi:hypothetical protein